MSSRLTRCHLAVVAFQTVSRRQADVAEGRVRPNRSFMATVALCCGYDMIDRFRPYSHAVTGTMASRAIAWGSLENAVEVTTVALCQGMGARQTEPRFGVVELF